MEGGEGEEEGEEKDVAEEEKELRRRQRVGDAKKGNGIGIADKAKAILKQEWMPAHREQGIEL